MEQKLYSHKVFEEKAIGEQLNEFKKTVDDLANFDVKLEDKIRQYALPKSFEHLKYIVLYLEYLL